MSNLNNQMHKPIGDTSRPLHIFAFGDMGKAEVDGSEQHWEEVPSLNTTKYMIRDMKHHRMDAVFHIGVFPLSYHTSHT